MKIKKIFIYFCFVFFLFSITACGKAVDDDYINFMIKGQKYESYKLNSDKTVNIPSVPIEVGYVFAGWYTDANYSTLFDFNNTLEKGSSLFGRMLSYDAIDVGSYNEGIGDLITESNASKATVLYRDVNTGQYTMLDSELIRQQNDTKTRFDIVGLSEGEYQVIALTSSGKVYYDSSIYVTSHDRSGYAHFGYDEGVGAYYDNGTLKDNAIVVYVTDETKNTVKATINGVECTGLVEILQNATNENESLCVRILGTINTTQWNKITYGTGNTFARQTAIEAAFDYDITSEYWDNETSSSSSRLYDDKIIELGINSMSDDEEKGLTKLNGLTTFVSRKKEVSEATWYGSGSFHEYDSYYNMLDVMQGKNITVEGIGEDAGIYQFGFTFKQSDSVEIRNLKFDDYTEDAIGFEGRNDTEIDFGNYWIHNCEFNVGVNNWDVCPENDKDDGDGSTDLKRCHNVTISYCKYNGTHKSNLIGSGDSIKQYNITLHHNYYYKCSQRLPLVRQTNIHMYNNYYYGSTSYSNSVRANAFAFIESCYYEGGLNPYEIITSSTYSKTQVKAYNNIYDGVTTKSGYYKTNSVYDRTTSMSGACYPTCDDIDYTNFDTNSELFYYDSVNNRSNVTLLTDAQTAKTDCINMSGVLKSSVSTYYTVSYELGSGTFDDAIISHETKVLKGKTLYQLPNVSNSLYAIEGWYTDSNYTTLFDSSTVITKDITLYAKWSTSMKATYKFSSLTTGDYTTNITNENYEILATSDKKVSVKSGNVTINNITFSNYINTGGAGSSEYRSIKITVNSNMKLTVYYSSGGSTDRCCAVLGNAYTYNTQTNEFELGVLEIGRGEYSSSTTDYKTYDINIKEGTYYITSGGSALNIYGYTLESIEEDVEELYTVSFVVNNTLYKEVLVNSNSNVTAFDNPTIAGYTFNSWTLNGEEYSFDTPISANTVVYANITELVVTGFDIDIRNTTTSFIVGSTFNYDGLLAYVIYEDNSTGNIDLSLCTIDTTNLDINTVGTYTLYVKYLTYSIPYEVAIVNSVTSIRVSELVLETIVVGTNAVDSLNTVVIGSGINGDVNISNDCEYTFSESDGVITVTVSYENCTTTYNVYRLEALSSSNPIINVDINYTGTPGAIVNGYHTFNKISQAIEYAEESELDVTITINVLEGTYNEKLTINAPNIRLIGAGYNKTIISNNIASGTTKPDLSGTWGTSGSATVTVKDTAIGFYTEGIYYLNSYDYINSNKDGAQAVAFYVMADMAVITKCRFSSYQDTLETKSGRQIFSECLIEGTVDYIFGYNSTTLFVNCEIKTLYRGAQGGYIAAFQGCNGDAGTDTVKYGAIFLGCNLTAESSVNSQTISLARPWRQDSMVAYIGCYMGSHIRTNGNESSGRYVTMSGNTAANARFFEYVNVGPGSISSNVTGVTLLTENEYLTNYTLINLLSADQGGVTYDSDWDASVYMYTLEGVTSSKIITQEYIDDSLYKALSVNYQTIFNAYSVDGSSSYIVGTTDTNVTSITYNEFTFYKGMYFKSACISNNKLESIYDHEDETNNQAIIRFSVSSGLMGSLTLTLSTSNSDRIVYVYKINDDGTTTLITSSYKTFTKSLSNGEYYIAFSNGTEPKITNIELL